MIRTPIARAVEIAGGQTALARLLGVTQGLVWQWTAGRCDVAAQHCIPIETATAGAVTRYDLRPDVFGKAPTAAREGEAA